MPERYLSGASIESRSDAWGVAVALEEDQKPSDRMFMIAVGVGAGLERYFCDRETCERSGGLRALQRIVLRRFLSAHYSSRGSQPADVLDLDMERKVIEFCEGLDNTVPVK